MTSSMSRMISYTVATNTITITAAVVNAFVKNVTSKQLFFILTYLYSHRERLELIASYKYTCNCCYCMIASIISI